jgi:hypothetical protein
MLARSRAFSVGRGAEEARAGPATRAPALAARETRANEDARAAERRDMGKGEWRRCGGEALVMRRESVERKRRENEG